MEERTQTIFKALNPYQIFRDLQLDITEHSGRCFVTHPKNRTQRYQIEKFALVSTDRHNPLPACHLLDFLSWCLDTYEEAVQYIFNKYYYLLVIPGGIDEISLRQELVRDLRQSYQQFKDITQLGAPFQERRPEMQRVLHYCRRQFLDFSQITQLIYPVLGAQLCPILHYATSENIEFEEEAIYFVYPYFKNRYTIAHLEIQEVGKEKIQTLVFNPSRFTYFGLASCLPDVREIQIYGERQTAIRNHVEATNSNQHLTGFLHIHTAEQEPEGDPIFAHGVYMQCSPNELATIARYQPLFSHLRIAEATEHFITPAKSMSWLGYVLNRFTIILLEDQCFSERARAFIHIIRTDDDALQTIVRYLEQKQETQVLQHLRKQVSFQRTFKVGSLEIRETPEGYVAKKKTELTPFTNFTIKIDCSVSFDNRDDIFYSGELVMASHHIPFLIAHNQVARSGQIIKAAHQAIKNADLVGAAGVPVILDTTLQNKLPSVLNQLVNHMPLKMGINRLGWSKNYTKFITPSWEASPDGIYATSKIVHPDAEIIFGHYNPRAFTTAINDSVLPGQARYFIAIVTSLLTRAFLKLPTPPVALLRTLNSVTLLQCIFRPLGQIEPIVLTRASWREILSENHFVGFPIYATLDTPALLGDIDYPLLVLSDMGLSIPQLMDDVLQAAITSTTYRILASLLLRYLKHRNLAHQFVCGASDATPQSLALEGKSIIEQCSCYKSWDLTDADTPLFHQVLAHIPGPSVIDFFRYDMSD